ncbi:ribbon-helix-helix protein, CopG family [Novosphingobium naphthalenivorans]|uniref:ribbon-helix-helix protein, CopG family n=1 Tax=Novosphingobium naphthalenivorans TaxID=273168 RepID=UPI000A05589E|nr:ribbon-helix-helix protein, CopG family [Novosphingobium naphthalenivorans]
MAARKMPKVQDRLTISLEAGDRAKLETLANKTDRSLAWLVREAIKQYLADRESGVA